MCRILVYNGRINNEQYREILKEFSKLGEKGCVPCGIEPGHLDGWGIHSSNNEENFYFRSINPILEKTILDVSNNITGTGQTVIHLRKRTVAKNMLCNTHPFMRSGISFCHNGSIHTFPENDFIHSRYLREGHTDSETFFIRILERINVQVGDASLEEIKSALIAEVEEIKKTSDWTSLTCVIKSPNGIILNYLWNENHAESEKMKFKDYYTFYKGKKGNSIILCSEKLNIPGFDWEKLENNTVLVLKNKTP